MVILFITDYKCAITKSCGPFVHTCVTPPVIMHSSSLCDFIEKWRIGTIFLKDCISTVAQKQHSLPPFDFVHPCIHTLCDLWYDISHNPVVAVYLLSTRANHARVCQETDLLKRSQCGNLICPRGQLAEFTPIQTEIHVLSEQSHQNLSEVKSNVRRVIKPSVPTSAMPLVILINKGNLIMVSQVFAVIITGYGCKFYIHFYR